MAPSILCLASALAFVAAMVAEASGHSMLCLWLAALSAIIAFAMALAERWGFDDGDGCDVCGDEDCAGCADDDDDEGPTVPNPRVLP